MKFEVYDANPPVKEVIRLRLITEGGIVKLVAVDASGVTVPGGFLLGFDPGKRGFYLCSSVGHALGFDLDGAGCLKTR